MTLLELEKEAWRVVSLNDKAATREWAARSEIHSMLMSGRIRIMGRPRSKSGVPLFPLRRTGRV